MWLRLLIIIKEYCFQIYEKSLDKRKEIYIDVILLNPAKICIYFMIVRKNFDFNYICSTKFKKTIYKKHNDQFKYSF